MCSTSLWIKKDPNRAIRVLQQWGINFLSGSLIFEAYPISLEQGKRGSSAAGVAKNAKNNHFHIPEVIWSDRGENPTYYFHFSLYLLNSFISIQLKRLKKPFQSLKFLNGHEICVKLSGRFFSSSSSDQSFNTLYDMMGVEAKCRKKIALIYIQVI